jgi:hypothetical protein
VYTQRLSSLEFFTYAAFLTVVALSIASMLPGRKPPVRTEPYPDDELHAHDPRLPKYFLAGGAFLLLGGLHMVLKNLPWTAEWLARAGYAGHLVRDLSNTHVMIVGGGTLISTGLCWYVLPRIVGRPLTSSGLAQCAFWFTAVGLLLFYVALIANGIAMGRLVSSGWDYEAAKLHMGKAYRVPVGIGAGIMGIGYWCFAANVFLTIFQSRLVRVPKPSAHLWKFVATGAAGLTVGTVQGVIQVQPAHADWLYRAAAAAGRSARRCHPRGRMDRPDQPRPHQSRHGPHDADGRGSVRARAGLRRDGAFTTGRKCLLLVAAHRLARVLRRRALPGLP